jgi:hypothetical protein
MIPFSGLRGLGPSADSHRGTSIYEVRHLRESRARILSHPHLFTRFTSTRLRSLQEGEGSFQDSELYDVDTGHRGWSGRRVQSLLAGALAERTVMKASTDVPRILLTHPTSTVTVTLSDFREVVRTRTRASLQATLQDNVVCADASRTLLSRSTINSWRSTVRFLEESRSFEIALRSTALAGRVNSLYRPVMVHSGSIGVQ